MCYYNGILVSKEEHIRLKDLEKEVAQHNFLNRPLQSGFDYGLYPVLKKRDDEKDFDIVLMEWGFLPVYAKTRKEADFLRKGGVNSKTGKFEPPKLTLNAIGEEILDKSTFKQAVRTHRCLVLSSGFFEWKHVYPLNKKTGQPLKTAVKYPHYISVRDKEYFFMAGIYNNWTDRETGEHVESFAILTTAANELMEQIHNSKKRMPVIFTDAQAWQWLMEDLTDEQIHKLAITQFPSDEMQARTIAKDFQTALNPCDEFIYEDLVNRQQELF